MFSHFFAGPAHAASHAASIFEGKTITEIAFSSPQPLDPKDLERLQPLKTGNPLHSADVANAIDALFATGRFADIAVEAEPSGNGIQIRFITENVMFVGAVALEGKLMDAPNRGQAFQALNLTLGAPFRPEAIDRAVENLRTLLQKNGLYDAQVTPVVTRDERTQLVSLAVRVHESKRAKYETPTVRGETTLSDTTLLRITGWRLPVIHWWRHVTEARTRRGVQNLLKRTPRPGSSHGKRGAG